MRQVQPPAPTGSALDAALAKLTDIKLPTPQDFFPGNQPSAAERNEAFLATGVDRDAYLQQNLQKPISPYEIKAGSIIPAALITGLNSDLPGQIVGQVTEPVYDTVTGQHLLIPQGTKIVGRYNANIGYGQDRLQIVWDRLIMPNGNSIGLESMIGTDKTGAAGLEDQVDYHIPGLVGAVLLSSIIGAGANLATDSSADGSFIDDLGDTAAQQAASVGLRHRPPTTRHPTDGHRPTWLPAQHPCWQGHFPGALPVSAMTRRKIVFGAATLAFCGTLMLGMTSEAPLILYPITPSLYVRNFEPPKIGMIAAFRVPEAAKRYKASLGEDVDNDFLFMKPIVAGPGNHVCQSSERFDVKREKMARIVIQSDTNRHRPPPWPICRLLANDEFFMMSMHLPNSLDSRYFGPISRSQILGSYRSLTFDQGRP